jgi:hypothetical protein
MSRALHSVLSKAFLVLLLTGALVTDRIGFSKPARAAQGMPDSPEFGYGARLDIWGQEVQPALKAAASIGVEWIGLDFDWARHWPDASNPVDLDRLDQVIAWAQEHRLYVLLSISNTPAWARGPSGPDPNQVAGLAVMLAKRYPDTLLAIELFPGANTAQGWGAPPDPKAYSALLKTCQAALQSSGTSAVPVAGGLSPLPASPASTDMDDLSFLNGLYQAGAADYMPILGLRLERLEGEALAPPSQATLRRYEAVRQVMLQFNHTGGLIWITGFDWPDFGETDRLDGQIRWLNQAYQLMKSQLYIGVAFFDHLNPPERGGSASSLALSLIIPGDDGPSLHPALEAIGQIISLNRNGHTSFQLFLHKRLDSGLVKRSLKPRGP